MVKKFFAELVGTMVLVLMGCGVAVSLSCGTDTSSVVGTAMAFGLSVVAMAYAIGGISGCLYSNETRRNEVKMMRFGGIYTL